MRQRTKWGIVALVCACALTLCACAASPGDGAGQASSTDGSDAASAQPGSLQAVHVEASWKAIQDDPSKKTCFSCHPRDTIVEKTKDFMGIEGVNPHASHTESYDCTKCHSLSGANVLVCNTACHGGYHGDGTGWPLPNENWQSPTEELPAADGVAIPANMS